MVGDLKLRFPICGGRGLAGFSLTWGNIAARAASTSVKRDSRAGFMSLDGLVVAGVREGFRFLAWTKNEQGKIDCIYFDFSIPDFLPFFRNRFRLPFL